jgi:hypothetical protein
LTEGEPLGCGWSWPCKNRCGSAAQRRRLRSPEEITVFDSTGLAIQDLAIGVEVVKRFRSDANAGSFSNVQEIDIG